MAYLRQQGKDEVYDVSGATPRHVSYDEAVKNNIWGDVSDVGYDPSKPQPTTPTTPTTVRYQPEQSPYQQYMNQLYGGGAPSATFDSVEAQDRIRQQQISNYQGLIDSINQNFSQAISREQQAGIGREGQVRAMQARGGILGAPMGEAQTEKVKEGTRQNVAAIENERQLKIQSIFQKIDEQTQSRVEAEKNEAFAKSEKYLEYLKQTEEETKQNIISLAGQGVDYNQLDPSDKQTILKQTGMSEAMLSSLWNANMPKNQQKKYTWDVRKDGSLVRYDDTGEFKVFEDTKLPDEVDPQFINADNGDILFVDKNDPTNPDGTVKYQNLGNYAKPVPGGGGDGVDAQLYAGLDSKTATAVRAKAGAFKSEPIITNFNVINEGYNFAKSIPNNTTSPSDNQAMIYAFAKIMDPNSVVREGEYATVQKYAQSWADSFGFNAKRIFSNSKFLSETAIKNMKETIERKYQASKKNYENTYNQYIQGINNLTGRTDGDKFITDYSGAYETPEDKMTKNEIWVKDKASGQTGTIPEDEFDPSLYDKINDTAQDTINNIFNNPNPWGTK